MSALDLGFSFLVTLALHATVLLGAAWLLERAGALKHPGWAELAWRTALFGALLSATLEFVPLPGEASLAPRTVAVATQAASMGAATGTAPRSAASSFSAEMDAAGFAAPPPASASPASPARVPVLSVPRAPAGVQVPDLAAWLLIGLWLAGLMWGAIRLLV